MRQNLVFNARSLDDRQRPAENDVVVRSAGDRNRYSLVVLRQMDRHSAVGGLFAQFGSELALQVAAPGIQLAVLGHH